MYPRTLAAALQRTANLFPVVTVTGPRQSGKTTLVRNIFPEYRYVSLELPDAREFATEDPKGFLKQYSGPAIFDEVQRVPSLMSYIQVMVDEEPDWMGRYILTGSQHFLLLESISQSLAGRNALLHLLPFSLAELQRRSPLDLAKIGQEIPPDSKPPAESLFETLWTGFYPRIHDKNIPARDWLANYYRTYVERDVRTISNIGDLEAFGRFVRLCAGRSGQILNLSSLASDCGITHTTAKRWLSVLETSFVITLLRPHHANFGKRLIKRPKLYFLDTGLLCYLLQIRSPDELFHRAERGAVFESLVVSEFLKNFLHRGEEPNLCFWRDSAGHEVDILLDQGDDLVPVEIKSGQTVAADAFAGLRYWMKLAGAEQGPAALVYGGDEAMLRSGIALYPWFSL